MRNVLAIFACLGLTGCILPPAISYASMVLDGASYVATGKSVSDHALSAAVEQDCAVWRVVSEQDVEAVCQEYADDDAARGFVFDLEVDEGGAAPPTQRHPDQPARPAEVVLAGATPAEPPTKSPIAAAEPATELAITPAPEPVEPPLGFDPEKIPSTADDLPAVANRKAIYLVVGSFRTIDSAERLAARMPDITTAIAPTLIGDDRYYRVVAGPYEPEETGDAQSRLAAAGMGNTWAASLCTGDLGAPPCGGSP